MPQLQSLDLRGTRVTDAGLEHLKGLTQLQELKLPGVAVTGAGVTETGVAELKKALPNARIER